jgi:hypothetical protein
MGQGLRWAKFAKSDGIKSGYYNWGWQSSHIVGESNIRLNEWFRLVWFSVNQDTNGLPVASVHVLLRASDELLEIRSEKTEDIRLKQESVDPIFVNSRGQEIKVR